MDQFKELVKEWVDDDMSDTVLSIIDTDGSSELKAQIYWFWKKHQDQLHDDLFGGTDSEGWN